jgi:hypothetical protein
MATPFFPLGVVIGVEVAQLVKATAANAAIKFLTNIFLPQLLREIAAAPQETSGARWLAVIHRAQNLHGHAPNALD